MPDFLCLTGNSTFPSSQESSGPRGWWAGVTVCRMAWTGRSWKGHQVWSKWNFVEFEEQSSRSPKHVFSFLLPTSFTCSLNSEACSYTQRKLLHFVTFNWFAYLWGNWYFGTIQLCHHYHLSMVSVCLVAAEKPWCVFAWHGRGRSMGWIPHCRLLKSGELLFGDGANIHCSMLSSVCLPRCWYSSKDFETHQCAVCC